MTRTMASLLGCLALGGLGLAVLRARAVGSSTRIAPDELAEPAAEPPARLAGAGAELRTRVEVNAAASAPRAMDREAERPDVEEETSTGAEVPLQPKPTPPRPTRREVRELEVELEALGREMGEREEDLFRERYEAGRYTVLPVPLEYDDDGNLLPPPARIRKVPPDTLGKIYGGEDVGEWRVVKIPLEECPVWRSLLRRRLEVGKELHRKRELLEDER